MTKELKKELLELTEYLLGDTTDKEVIEVYADTITNFAKIYHKEQLALLRVSCQRGQLKAKKLKDLKNWIQSDVKSIDSGIIKPKETEITRFKRKILDKIKEIESLYLLKNTEGICYTHC